MEAMLMFFSAVGHAEEGMWLPGQLDERASQLQALGINLPPTQLADKTHGPLGAIVHVGDYCSGSFVSPDGLVLTNHHCVWDLLQFNTTPEHDFLASGFIAHDRSGERWGGPTGALYIDEKEEDVTSKIASAVATSKSDAEAARAVERAETELVDICERATDRRCEVTSEFGGRNYRLITRRVIRDLRLVFVPPMSVGSFGGDLDNFEWPRHDGDFAVLRAYVAPNGGSSTYSRKNVPYKSENYLRVQPAGASPGEAVMVAGFPGSTQRYALLSELEFLAQTAYPRDLAMTTAIQDVLADEASRSAAAKAILGGLSEELANDRKYYQGLLDGVAATDLLAKHKVAEDGVRAWMEEQPDADRRIVSYHAYNDVIQKDELALWKRQAYLEEDLPLSDLLRSATTIVHLAHERLKPDRERRPGFQERDRAEIADALEQVEHTLWLPADRRILALGLQELSGLDEPDRPAIIATLTADGIAPALDRLYDHPSLANTDYRLGLMKRTCRQLEASTDPWIQLAVGLEPDYQRLWEDEDAVTGAVSRLAPEWVDAVSGKRGGDAYPDANNTLRVTVGRVVGYSPRDGVVMSPQTTVAGLLAKVATGRYDDPPVDFLEAARASKTTQWIDARLGDVPVDFLSDLDTTGGNSGSATLNAKGELVGLLFDGNYESIDADWMFDPALTRSIHLDIRYLLFVLDQQPDSRWLVGELLQGA